MKLSTKFKYYIHGKAVAQDIEKKVPHPVDARRGELTRELNRLLSQFFQSTSTSISDLHRHHLPNPHPLLIINQGVHMPGKAFPKSDNPYEVIEDKGWPIRLILTRPDSLLLPEELALGFRNCDD